MGEFVLILFLTTGTPGVATNHVYFASLPACQHAKAAMMASKTASRWIEYGECFSTGLGASRQAEAPAH